MADSTLKPSDNSDETLLRRTLFSLTVAPEGLSNLVECSTSESEITAHRKGAVVRCAGANQECWAIGKGCHGLHGI